ncbi:MAG: hypothetical protein AAF587_02605 [Bacteroidota bacterium]
MKQLFLILFIYTGFFLHAQDGPITAHLGQDDHLGLDQIRTAFKAKNEGYDLAYFRNLSTLYGTDQHQVIFVQGGETDIRLSNGLSSRTSIGDIILLKPHEQFQADSLLNVLVFQVPEAPPAELPFIIRPDWDENITDTPGGCATETGAYRRILLTWKEEVGPYRFHSINAHRVRIMDSFSHYHPVVGGFDEFYLVQMVMPGARLLTSTQVPVIEKPKKVSKETASSLLHAQKLSVGDLVYLPRGTMHRGLGGVLAQVITVPGFVPMSEIGLDHHLFKINKKLKLTGEEALPYHEAGAKKAIIK